MCPSCRRRDSPKRVRLLCRRWCQSCRCEFFGPSCSKHLTELPWVATVLWSIPLPLLFRFLHPSFACAFQGRVGGEPLQYGPAQGVVSGYWRVAGVIPGFRAPSHKASCLSVNAMYPRQAGRPGRTRSASSLSGVGVALLGDQPVLAARKAEQATCACKHLGGARCKRRYVRAHLAVYVVWSASPALDTTTTSRSTPWWWQIHARCCAPCKRPRSEGADSTSAGFCVSDRSRSSSRPFPAPTLALRRQLAEAFLLPCNCPASSRTAYTILGHLRGARVPDAKAEALPMERGESLPHLCCREWLSGRRSPRSC